VHDNGATEQYLLLLQINVPKQSRSSKHKSPRPEAMNNLVGLAVGLIVGDTVGDLVGSGVISL
jgi:hypothetical protein